MPESAFHNSIVGLDEEIEAAQNEKCNPADVPRLLNIYRVGMEAKAELEKGFRGLVYEVAQMDDDRRFDWLGNLWQGFADAIRRLGNNKEANIEKFIREELQRSIKDYYREVSQNILAKEDDYPDLHRVRAVHKYPRKGPEYCIDPLEDEETMVKVHYVASSPEHDVELRDECKWVESKAKTPLEKAVLAGIKAGNSQREMVVSLGVTRYEVQKAVKTIKNGAVWTRRSRSVLAQKAGKSRSKPVKFPFPRPLDRGFLSLSLGRPDTSPPALPPLIGAGVSPWVATR